MRFFWFSCGFNLFKSSSHIKKFTKIFTFSYILFASVICISLSVIIIIIIITFMFVRFRIKHTTIDIFFAKFFLATYLTNSAFNNSTCYMHIISLPTEI